MEHRAKDNNAKSNHAYSPSWVDRLTDWVARLPGSSWIYYLGLGVVLLLLPSSVFWMEGVGSIGMFHPVHVFLARSEERV